MRRCIIIHNGTEYSKEEFKKLVLEQGIGGVFSDSIDLAQKLVAKYDVLNQEDSLMEMWAKLEASRLGVEYLGTSNQIQSLLQPKGQLTDYSTQEEIRYNTYSGISLTGISANFGKVMGYVFETSPVQSIKDLKTGKTIQHGSQEELELLKEFEVSSLDELVIDRSRFAVTAREPVMLRESSRFSVNGQLVDRFSRTELKLEPKQATSNIFETIDTIINLAIDNVKEQKLHVLGITNANANSYLNMIGMGLPLSTVSKIFKLQSVKSLNDSGRYSEEKIEKGVVEPALAVLNEVEFDKLKVIADSYGINIAQGDKSVKIKSPNISTKLLTKIHSGQATRVEEALMDAVVGKVLERLTPINETMFEYAQIFSTLRSFPNKKWKMDSVISKIEKYATFTEEEAARVAQSMKFEESLINNFQQNSPVYKQLLEEKGEEAAKQYVKEELEKLKDNPALYGEFERAYRSNFVNSLIRGRKKRKIATPSSSPLENSSPLLLPHVYEAYVSLTQLRNIIERLFAVHSPTIQKFVAKVLDEASVFSPFDALEKADTAQKDLVKYLSAELEFKLWDIPVSLKVDPKITYTAGTTTVHGAEAWSQRFINTITELEIEDDNQFLAAIEPATIRDTGLKTLRILSDKVNDEELLEVIREDFKIFAKKHPQLAADLFKYNALTNAMYYEKTGFSLVFPDKWAVAFSQALSERLNTLIPIGQVKTQYNLETLKEDFLFQFVRNNPELIRFPSNAKAEQTGEYVVSTSKGPRKMPYYGGQVDGVHFDLRLTATDKPQKFVRQYNDDVYMLVHSTGGYDHYIKITEQVGHKFYSFTPHQVEESLSLKKLGALAFSGKVINAARVYNMRYFTETDAEQLPTGQRLFAYDKGEAHVTSASIYEVTGAPSSSKNRGNTSLVYNLRYIGERDLTGKEEAVSLKERLGLFVSDQLGTVTTISDISSIKPLLLKRRDNILITNEQLPDVPCTVLSIPRWSVRPTPTEVDAALAKLFKEISELKTSDNLFVSSDLLAPLAPFMSVKRKVAEYLYNHLGYAMPDMELEEREVVTAEATALQAMIKQRELNIIVPRTGIVLENTTAGEAGTTKFPKSNLNKSTASSLAVGDILYLGKIEEDDAYAIVQKKTDSTVYVTLFNQDFFLKHIESHNYPLDVFEELYNNYLKC